MLWVLLAATPARAEEWHEAYRTGMTALSRGQPQQAIAALQRAIAMRPEPGRNVVTYGTNIEPRYFPYLGLAEALIAVGQYETAREALQASARWQREPADERLRLQARLDNALEAQRAPAATPAATPPPSAPPPSLPAASTPPAATPAPAAIPPPTPAPATPPAAAPARPPLPSRGVPAEGAREPSPGASVAPPAAPATGTLEVVSQPPGAVVYLDDEPLGSSDPQSGRLLKPGLRPGRHRVRVEIAGHEATLGEIEMAAGGSVTFHAAPKPLAPAAGGPGLGWIGFGIVALALVGAASWLVLRRPADSTPLWTATPPARASGATPGSPTPRGQANPGAHLDAQGQEWFGEFRLLEILGRGGMASVYKAARGPELLALKRPLASLLDEEGFRERFLREAEIGRTLNHPSIVRILGRGEVEGVPYFTMELLAGQTLHAWVRTRTSQDPRAAAAIVVQAAEALDFAHGKGVVHRDLKPSNIMLLPDGAVKVMDFGIARAQRLEGITATGAFLGTPDYVAPEVIEGRRAEPRSDLYSLGVVFYELLTGQRPFTGETAFAVLKKHVAEPATPPSLVRPGIPDELDALVRRLLAKDPGARPASAEELVVALRDWLNRAA